MSAVVKCALFAAAVVLVVVLSGCQAGGRGLVRGEGLRVAHTLDVAGFTGLEIYGAYDVTFRQGDAFSAVLEIQANLFEYVEAGVSGGVLRVGAEGARPFIIDRGQTPRLVVYAPDLRSLSVRGAASANVEVDTEAFDVEISGAGSVVLAGSASRLGITVTGAADVRAFDMTSAHATVGMAGTGSVEVYASQTLDVSIAGVGSVRYDGNATVTRSISGVGTISRR